MDYISAGRSTGEAEVVFSRRSDAEIIVRSMSGTRILGQPIYLDLAIGGQQPLNYNVDDELLDEYENDYDELDDEYDEYEDNNEFVETRRGTRGGRLARILGRSGIGDVGVLKNTVNVGGRLGGGVERWRRGSGLRRGGGGGLGGFNTGGGGFNAGRGGGGLGRFYVGRGAGGGLGGFKAGGGGGLGRGGGGGGLGGFNISGGGGGSGIGRGGGGGGRGAGGPLGPVDLDQQLKNYFGRGN
jgi:hypothetical protein